MKLTTAALSVAIALAAIVPASSAGAEGISFVKTQEPTEIMAYRLGGTNVFNSKGEKIGTVADIALSASGQAKVMVLSVGGFLGINSKYVGIPFSDVKIGPAVEAGRVIFIDTTKEQLSAAPAYTIADPSRTDRAKNKAEKWFNVAKDKAIELGKQAKDQAVKLGNDAKDAVKDMRENMDDSSKGAAKPADGATKN